MKDRHIADIRALNRFYTTIIGLLDQHILNSGYALHEAQIRYVLYHHENLTASDIIASLGIDKEYLSRIFLHLEKKKLLSKKRSGEDGRSIQLSLTKKGRSEFETLNPASNMQIKKTLEPLTDADCNKLVSKIAEIKQIISKANQNN